MTHPCSNCNRDDGWAICTTLCGRRPAAQSLPHQHEGDTALAVGNLIYALQAWKASKPGAKEEWPALVDACAGLVAAARPATVSPQRAELVAAWNDLPDSIRCHPGLKRLFRACQVA